MRELTRLAWPIAVSMVSYAVMTLVDTLFVGWLGSSELAGVGLGGTASFALMVFAFGLLRGVKIVVSQARGAGDEASGSAYLGAGLILASILSVIALAAAVGVENLLPHAAATEAAAGHAQAYFHARTMGIPAIFIYVALREARYGMGDSRWPMVASVSGNVLNIALDYAFIFGLEMGVAGAAWATVAAQALEASVLLWVQSREGFRLGGVRMSHIAAVWRLGLPSGLQFLLEMGSFAVLAALLSKLSELDMAAHMIALQCLHFSFLPAVALGEAASVMVGEAVGARKEILVKPIARLAMKAAGVYTGVCTAVFFFGRDLLAGGFTEDPELAGLAAQLLIVAAIFQVADGANIVARGVLRGVGDVKVPAAICIGIAWALTPPMTWLLGYVAGWGALGGWIGLCAEIIAAAAVLWWRLERGGWRAAAERARLEREAAAEKEERKARVLSALT